MQYSLLYLASLLAQATVGRRRRDEGRGERRERKKKRKRKRKKKEGKKYLRVCSGFQNPFLYHSRFFRTKFCFLCILIVFSIFNKYDPKLNFRATILN